MHKLVVVMPYTMQLRAEEDKKESWDHARKSSAAPIYFFFLFLVLSTSRIVKPED